MKKLIPELDAITGQIGQATQLTDETTRILHGHLDAIARLTTTIHAIADQSKLLALNTSIEAARIGNAGRGLGVVASEMKTLASQAADTATGIDACLADAFATANANGEAVTSLRAAVERRMRVTEQLTSFANKKE